jgi:hypothetical protein
VLAHVLAPHRAALGGAPPSQLRAAAAARAAAVLHPGVLARWGHSATAIGRRVVVFGGCTSSGRCCSDLLLIDLEACTVSRMQVHGPPPAARRHHSAVAVAVPGPGSPLHTLLAGALLREHDGSRPTAAGSTADVAGPGQEAVGQLAPAACSPEEGALVVVFGGEDSDLHRFGGEELHVLWVGRWESAGNCALLPG